MFPSFLRESRCNEKQDKQEAFIRVISDAPISAGNLYRLILALLTDTRNISRYSVGHMTQPWKTSKFFCFCFLNREALFMTQNTEGNSKSKNSISMTRQFIYFLKTTTFFCILNLLLFSFLSPFTVLQLNYLGFHTVINWWIMHKYLWLSFLISVNRANISQC